MENTYDHLPNIEEINKDNGEFENDDNDPKSINYHRVLTIPKIKVLSVILNILFFIIGVFVTFVISFICINDELLRIILPILVAFIYMFIRLSSILIFLVECYQLIAPKKVRLKCRFEPSCSDYMIMAIKKYGAIKGLIKGIKRIIKCHYPNGGYDLP